jgi:hypothetical protein
VWIVDPVGSRVFRDFGTGETRRRPSQNQREFGTKTIHLGGHVASDAKEDTWRVVKVQGKSRKVVGRRSSWIMVVGSRGIWTVDLSRGRFRHFIIGENRGESQLALIPEIVKGEIVIEQGPSIQRQI